MKPLGYEYGPDSMAFVFNAAYTVPGVFNAGLKAEYIINGENTINTAFALGADAVKLKTPTGTPEGRLILGLYGNYEVLSFLSLNASLAYIKIANYNHTENTDFNDFQSAFGIVFKL